MLGTYSKKSKFRLSAEIALALFILAAMTGSAIGQVVLVTSKLRPSRVSSKSKSRPKSKQQPVPESIEEAVPAQAAEPAPAPESAFPHEQLSFVVNPPPLSKMEAANGRKEARESREPADSRSSTLWPNLLGYEFEVIKLDERGHTEERRKERARFYVENLNGGVNLEMVEIPSGTFLMGSSPFGLEQIEMNYSRGGLKDSKSELQQRLKAETPQRIVKVSAFFVGKYEVTQAQWRAVASLPKVNRELMSDPSHFKGGNRPVEQISWEDAVEFCERLSRATGRHYRLPTEAEWEYACRSGTKWPFSLG